VRTLDRLARGVRVTGELDLATSPQLAAALEDWIADGEGDVSVELAGVTFIDSTAIGVLVQAHLRQSSSGVRLRIVDPSAVVLRVLHLAGLLTVLQIDTSGGVLS